MSGPPTDGPAVHRLHGRVLLPEEDLPVQAAAMTVRVEDVSRADAPSVVVAQSTLTGVRLREGAVAFDVDVPSDRIDPRARYTLSVHVDVTGSGSVQQGDLLTTRIYPLRPDRDTDLDVAVQRV
jgi:putative lipoprotein